MNEAARCFLCGRNTIRADWLLNMDGWRIECQLCGTYEISQFASDCVQGELLPYLIAHTRQSWEFERRVVQVNSNWQSLAELHSQTSPHQKFQKLMKIVAQRTSALGYPAKLNWEIDYPLFDATDKATVPYLIDYGKDLGYLDEGTPECKITFKGWDYLDPASGGAGRPGHVFVAMSFDSSLDEAYDFGIKPAIEVDCKMTPVRVDRIHHNEKICDKILASIRGCQIVVADFTMQRNGAYFEAGFAMALGRLVIWTCREDEVDKLHFDTRQYPHILWKDAADLRSKLADRILALTTPSRS